MDFRMDFRMDYGLQNRFHPIVWKELSGEIVIIGREMHPDGTTCDKFAKLRLFKTCAN